MNSIEVRNLGKRYRLKQDRERSLKSVLLRLVKRAKIREDFWALRNLSFDVRKGETLGIIGANGAGKSTLLGCLAQTIRPTEGSLQVGGRVSSLLELGAGFHPELTGRENVFLNGSILGLSKKEIEQKYDTIVKFSELEAFMDSPVKHYSSGMYVRLGFAVAVEVDPDILLIDEVLAVGDEVFRKKCLSKIYDFKKAGKTLLIVSHDLDSVKRVSDRTLLLDHGKLIELGEPTKVVDDYVKMGVIAEPLMKKDWGSFDVEIQNVVFRNSNSEVTDRFHYKTPLTMEIFYKAKKRIERPVFGFSLADQEGKTCFGSNTQIQGLEIPVIEGEGKVTARIESIPLIRGKYFFSFAIHNEDHQISYHRRENAYVIWVVSERTEIGFVAMAVDWKAGS